MSFEAILSYGNKLGVIYCPQGPRGILGIAKH